MEGSPTFSNVKYTHNVYQPIKKQNTWLHDDQSLHNN